jgi:thiol-disulfide isomerase/thioredoxin
VKKCVSTLTFLGVALAFAGCSTGPGATSESWPVGYVERSLLATPQFHAFQARYDTVRVQEDLTEFVGRVREGAEVLVFFGGWCPDSKRDVPHFLKIADRAGFPAGSIKFYSLDRTKKSPDGLTEQFGIQLVPTFIFMREGGEVGRIVESPKTTLEQDMLEILAPRRD